MALSPPGLTSEAGRRPLLPLLAATLGLALALVVAGCGQAPAPGHARLVLSSTGLPSQSVAEFDVKGPGLDLTNVPAGSRLKIHPGRFSITTRAQEVGGHSYLPLMAGVLYRSLTQLVKLGAGQQLDFRQRYAERTSPLPTPPSSPLPTVPGS